MTSAKLRSSVPSLHECPDVVPALIWKVAVFMKTTNTYDFVVGKKRDNVTTGKKGKLIV